MSEADKKAPKKSAKASSGITAEERAAMRDLVKERKRNASKEEEERDALDKIAAMSQPDRGIAERLHALIIAAAPELAPKTWYGMPAYAKDGQLICFFQPAEKFKARYATLGFTDKAQIDDGELWPVTYALKELTPATEATITALVKKAVD